MQLFLEYVETVIADEESSPQGCRRTGPTPGAVQDATTPNLFWTRVISRCTIRADFAGCSLRFDLGPLRVKGNDRQKSPSERVCAAIDGTGHPRHIAHTLLVILIQRISQIASGFEECNERNGVHPTPSFNLGWDSE